MDNKDIGSAMNLIGPVCTTVVVVVCSSSAFRSFVKQDLVRKGYNYSVPTCVEFKMNQSYRYFDYGSVRYIEFSDTDLIPEGSAYLVPMNTPNLL